MTTTMVYVSLKWTRFCQWAGRRRLIRRGVFDEGFALHILLSSMFGKSVLQPFRVFRQPRGSAATLYAYTDRSEDALRDVAANCAPPDCLDVIDVDRLLTKRMPHRFREDQRLGFDVRVRPVRRIGTDITDSQSDKVLRKGSEIDAFRLAVLRSWPDGWKHSPMADARRPSREDVYSGWLHERFDGAADVDTGTCRVASFRRSRIRRGDGKGPEGPDVTMHGDLVIRDPIRFAAMLRRGLGRHRAYGYGMLILRPPGTTPRSK